MPIINRDYYGAGQRGREDALNQRAMEQRNLLGQMEVSRANQFDALSKNPTASPDDYARIGRTDVSNYFLGRDNAANEKKQADLKRLYTAAQYGVASARPKEFIAQNFPEIAAMNPNFAAETDETVKASLQDLIGRFGAQIGEGPAAAKGVGAMYKYVNDKGQGVYGSAEDVSGRPVYESRDERPPPSGYRWNNGRLEAIPGGPADPGVKSTKDDSRIFAKADKLRDEFNTQSKEFISVGDSYNTVKAAATDPSAAGDLSMIFAYMKMLDPNSVVREQEFANAQNAAGVPDRIRNQWNKILAGERLNPVQREDFIAQAKKVYEIRKKRNESVVKRYTDIAKRNNVNPDDVVGDLSVYEEGQQPAQPSTTAPAAPSSQPVRVNSAAEASALPPGTVFITPDGRRKVRP